MGRRPNGFYIPRFRNLDEGTKVKDFIRGMDTKGVAQEVTGRKILENINMDKRLMKPF